MKKLVIAIDGPAAAGKSTTAKLAAQRLGYLYVDTGAMYRAMTLKVLRHGIDLIDEEKISELATQTEVRLENDIGGVRVFLDKQDVTDAIRSPDVTNAVSAVSSYRKVREVMIREQRRMGERGGIVLEGRDIGTVVFPDADLKIYMVANVSERAKRRQEDLKKQGVNATLSDVIVGIQERDLKDSERNISPLRKAEDAIIIDTSDLTIDEQVETIVRKVKEILRQQS
ncbi:MAG: (d)CMP kinase [Ignavibacteriae bacterium]|nr:(d)CMP kinase [Ignavibacteriota bacterium]